MISSEADIPEDHWKILQERTRLESQGLDRALPLEEAFTQIRAKLQEERILREEGKCAQPDATAWPRELLGKRKAALQQGESVTLPLKEVASRLRARRAAKS